MRRINGLFKVLCLGLLLCILLWIILWNKLDLSRYLPAHTDQREAVCNSTRCTGTISNNGSTDLVKKSCRRCKHLVFIKVHKCGSDTVTDILFRVGMSNNVTFVLPKQNWQIAYYLKSNWTNIMPPPRGKSFDMLVLHAVYDRPVLDKLMPVDTSYVGIVRKPLNQTHSSVYYFAERVVPGDNKLSTFLNFPGNFTGHSRWLINSMSYELGLEKEYFYNETKIKEHLNKLDKEFILIMVLERMEESLILLRRLLCWEIEELLFIPKNANKKKPVLNATEEDIKTHQRIALADYMLYDFSVQRLQKQIDSEGQNFQEEVSHFRTILDKVIGHCSAHNVTEGDTLIIQQTKWNGVITVSRERCKSMSYHNIKMIERVKKYQYP